MNEVYILNKAKSNATDACFSTTGVPVSVAAKIFRKDPTWVRAGIIAGWLDIGIATRNGKQITSIDEIDGKKGRINFYISPKKLYEKTGFIWRGKKKEKNNETEKTKQKSRQNSPSEF